MAEDFAAVVILRVAAVAMRRVVGAAKCFLRGLGWCRGGTYGCDWLLLMFRTVLSSVLTTNIHSYGLIEIMLFTVLESLLPNFLRKAEASKPAISMVIIVHDNVKEAQAHQNAYRNQRSHALKKLFMIN